MFKLLAFIIYTSSGSACYTQAHFSTQLFTVINKPTFAHPCVFLIVRYKFLYMLPSELRPCCVINSPLQKVPKTMVQLTTDCIRTQWVPQSGRREEQKQTGGVLVRTPLMPIMRNHFQRQMRERVLSSVHCKTTMNCPHLILQKLVFLLILSRGSYSNDFIECTHNIELILQLFQIGSKISY